MALYLQDLEGTIFHYLVDFAREKDIEVLAYINDSIVVSNKKGDIDINMFNDFIKNELYLELILDSKELGVTQDSLEKYQEALLPSNNIIEDEVQLQSIDEDFIDKLLDFMIPKVWKIDKYLNIISSVCYYNHYPKNKWTTYVTTHNPMNQGSLNNLWDGIRHQHKNILELSRIIRDTDEETYKTDIYDLVKIYVQKFIRLFVVGNEVISKEYEDYGRIVHNRRISDGFKKNINQTKKVIALISGTGTGKTYAILDRVAKELKRNKNYRAIIISSYIGYAYDIYRVAKDRHGLNFVNYVDNVDIRGDPNLLIISCESIHKLKNNTTYDLVILDESESILDKFTSNTPTMRKQFYTKCLNNIQNICINSQRVWIMDGFMTRKTLNFIDYLRDSRSDPDDFEFVFNTYLKHSKIVAYGVDLISNQGKEATRCLKKWESALFNHCRDYNVYVTFTNAKKARYYFDLIGKICPNKVVKCYTRDSTSDEKDELKDVETNWKNANIVIVSPIAPVGVNFDPADPHFDCTFSFVDSNGPIVLISLQIEARTRKTTSGTCHMLTQPPRNDRQLVYRNIVASSITKFEDIDNEFYKMIRETHIYEESVYRKPEAQRDWLAKNKPVNDIINALAYLFPLEMAQEVKRNTTITDGMTGLEIRPAIEPQEGMVVPLVVGVDDFDDVKGIEEEYSLEFDEIPKLANHQLVKANATGIIEDEEYTAMERKQLFAKKLYLKAFLPSMRKPREDKEILKRLTDAKLKTYKNRKYRSFNGLPERDQFKLREELENVQYEKDQEEDFQVLDEIKSLYHDGYLGTDKLKQKQALHVLNVNVPFIRMYLSENPLKYLRSLKEGKDSKGRKCVQAGQTESTIDLLLMTELLKLHIHNLVYDLSFQRIYGIEDFLSLNINHKVIHTITHDKPYKPFDTSNKGKKLEMNLYYINKLLYRTIGGNFRGRRSNHTTICYDYTPLFPDLAEYIRPSDYTTLMDDTPYYQEKRIYDYTRSINKPHNLTYDQEERLITNELQHLTIANQFEMLKLVDKNDSLEQTLEKINTLKFQQNNSEESRPLE